MKECSKSIPRRLSSPNFINRYFVGNGLDIGGKPDPLFLYKELFCQIRSVKTWDWEDGDAQFLASVNDESFDFVHSSHCLEHLLQPEEGLKNWFRVLKPGGHLVITVPDEDLYEQGVFPSTFNRDHKWTFTIYKPTSWSKSSINVLNLVGMLGDLAQPIKIELLDATYRYGLPRYDQTLTPIAECGIEIIIRKRYAEELLVAGRLPIEGGHPDRETCLHLNQYRHDLNTLKRCNQDGEPFLNDKWS